jgi:carbon storage regulator
VIEMLVLTRKKGEAILLGDNIEITIVSVEDGNVKIAINAPKEIAILRKELLKEVTEENKEASQFSIGILESFKSK